MTALFRIVGLWRPQAAWLLAGGLVSLAALASLLGLLANSAAFAIGGAVAGGLTLRLLGTSRVVLRYFERLITHSALFRALAGLRVWFFRGLALRAAGGLGFRDAGDLLARLVNDVEALDAVYLRLLLPFAACVVLLPVLLVLFATVSPGLASIVGLLFALSAFVLPLVAARLSLSIGQQLTAAGAALRVACLDTLAGLREVRAFAAEGRMQALVAAREATQFAAEQRLSEAAGLAQAAAFLCAQFGVLAVLIAAGAHVSLVFIAAAAFELAGGMPRAGVFAGHAAAAATRLVQVAEGPIPVPDPASPVPVPANAALKFEAVHFRWAADRPPVLDGMTLDILPGSRVAILGPSGSGKSTLAALALKVVAPDAGRISIGGTDLASVAADDLRHHIAWLGQTTHLFADTIRANLLLGRPDATDADLWAALDDARIAAFVRGLPDGLDAYIGEKGANFSGGQARRLALARALLSRAGILILDEPCAGLDAQTEREFFAALNASAEGRTIILIAHRLTGAERLDRIYRLSSGHAVAAAR